MWGEVEDSFCTHIFACSQQWDIRYSPDFMLMLPDLPCSQHTSLALASWLLLARVHQGQQYLEGFSFPSLSSFCPDESESRTSGLRKWHPAIPQKGLCTLRHALALPHCHHPPPLLPFTGAVFTPQPNAEEIPHQNKKDNANFTLSEASPFRYSSFL